MSDTPDISVVMSVYNGGPYLRETIDSVLTQEGVLLEFIIVNDGSTDESLETLREYANRDPRLRIIDQDNQGLTSALIRGCAQARGKYIARQDVGDVSLPGRLAKQLACITQNADCAFVSCGTRFVGPEGEHLYDVNHDPSDATERLLSLELAKIRGPSIHGCTFFSRARYEEAGGYRPMFYFAQDLDLWLRLVEQGEHIIMPDVLYQASIGVASISSLYRKEQVEATKIILECASLRRKGLNEASALERMRSIRPSTKRNNSRIRRARALYFIGACLNERSRPQARKYFRQALKTFPLHLRSAARLLLR